MRRSRDGVLICLHDATVDRTSDGRGAAADLTFAQLRMLDAGSRHNPKYAGEKIPSLREVLELCRGKITVMLDLKEQVPEYADAITVVVKQYGEPRRLILGVRSVEQATQFRKRLPEAKQIGLIPHPEADSGLRRGGSHGDPPLAPLVE